MKPSSGDSSDDLIPGIPNEVAELCLLHLPFPHFALARSISSTWNKTLSNPSFLRSKSNLSLSLPYLFVIAFERSSRRLQLQALDPRSRRWFVLPSIPIDNVSGGSVVCPPSLAIAGDGERGEIYVMGGLKRDGGGVMSSVLVYSAASNSWRVGKEMRRRRSFFTAAAIGGKIYVAGGGDGEMREVECYDPAVDRWEDVAPMRSGLARYDGVVMGKKLLVTEGWTWPFTFSPRGSIYDADCDSWEEMSIGMRDGWTGTSAVVAGRLFIVSEYGEGWVKAYDPVSDTWAKVAGSGVPGELKKPYAVVGSKDVSIYVVGSGMDVGVGSLVEEGNGWRIEWEVIKGPKSLMATTPCNSLVLYA